MSYIPSWDDFQRQAEEHEIIPVYLEIPGDLETPVSLYYKVCRESRHSFLLESAERSGTVGRYSFIGFSPRAIIRSSGKSVEIEENGQTQTFREDPVKVYSDYLKKYKSRSHAGLPRFVSGGVGYFSYDMVRYFEAIPDSTINDMKLPESYFVFVDTVLSFDHFLHSIRIIANAVVKDRDLKTAYDEAIATIEYARARILKQQGYTDYRAPVNGANKVVLERNTERKDFENSVNAARDYIYKGDIFQVVLSQRFSTELSGDPFNVYRALRSINPSPYMFFLNFDNLQIIGSSPEVLVKAEDGIAVSRPLAGTIRRGESIDEDNRLARKLIHDPKERAEHVMLVDLARNDLGRFCEYKSIKIPEKLQLERYSHVMHIVSHVEGKIRRGTEQMDILRGAFPAGTVSGAPKIRAMEIIDELEPTRRGVYAGAVGYFDLFGNLDFCIAIRTLVCIRNKVYIQSGAGIVADSVPEKEYLETINKARAMIRALELAEGKRYDFSH